jgi:DNA-binding SARP family transcriptional activator
MASRDRFKLALLGGFVLRRGDREIPIAANGQRLIALLALNDRPIARARAAGMLWPDFSTHRSLADLRTTLWRVNQSAEGVVAASRSSLLLGENVEVDVRLMIAVSQRLRDDPSSLAGVDLDAVPLTEISRDLLPDWYEEWVQDEREGLRQIRLHTLEAIATVLSEAGRHADAIQVALAAIRLEPLRETAHRTLVEAHIAEGNWSEARRQFQRCRRLLREELGVEPSESIRRLVESEPIFAASPASSSRTAIHPPGSPSSTT